MGILQSANKFFDEEIQKLQQIQTAMGKDIEDLKVKQETLSVKYQTTSQQLEALENQVANLAIQSDEVHYLFMLPDRAEWFSGRESELDNLHKLLQKSQDISELGAQIASVCGLGGSGKTSMAAEYAHRRKDHYEGGVFWFSGDDEEKFANSVDEHAVYFGTLEESSGKTLVKTLEVISKIEKPWLLVLDDMDEYKLSSNIGMLLSGPWKRRVKGSGHILITTRRKPKVMSEIRGFKESQCLQLECFNPEDGKEFVFKRTGLNCDEETSSQAANLVETLGGLPLALEQACAYINYLSCNLSMYLEQYQKYSLELLDEKDASPASLCESPERLAVRTTWLLNFQYIKRSKNGSFAVRFLHASAFFNPIEIQQDLINPGKPPIEDEAYRDYVDTPLGSSHILRLLTDFSLFKKTKRSSLSVHRLVQEVIREKLKSDNQEILSLVDAIRMLSFAFSKCPSPDDLLTSGINTHDRASTLATNPSLFYSWKKLCLHAEEVLAFLNSIQSLDEKILIPETAKIVYECALDFDISRKTDKATQSVDFAHKIIYLSSMRLTKSDLADMFPHKVPLSESTRRYIFYSCVSPPETDDLGTSDKNSKSGSKSKMEQMHAQGSNYFNTENFQKAVEMYSSAIAEVSSFDPKLLCDRALAYINLQQYKNALADSEKYLLENPRCWLGLAMKALALHGLNETWEANSYAALAFYHNRNVFCILQSFKDTFSTLEKRIYICNNSSRLMDSLLRPVSDPRAVSESPGKIVMLEPGEYLLNVDNYPVNSPSLLRCISGIGLPSTRLVLNDCILLGVENSKSSVVIRFHEKPHSVLDIISCGHVMAANVSFVFSKGNWETQPYSVTTLLNCSFRSSLDESNYTFFSLGTDTFRNCSFENCKSPGLTVKGKTNVEKCIFSGGEYSGVSVADGGCLEIRECKIYGNDDGMYIAEAVQMCKVTNCEIFDNKHNGVYVTNNALNVEVKNCRIYQNDRHGISIEDSSSAFISNNKIFENGWQGIATLCNGRCTVSHNKIYGNKSGGVQVVPVDSRKELSESIVEFNEIDNNRGHQIYCDMVAEGTQWDSGVHVPGENVLLQLRDYQQNSKYFKEAKCKGNKIGESTHSSAASMGGRIHSDICSYCHKRCSSNCSKCFVTSYCDKECQTRDWKKHRKECHSIFEESTVRVNILPNKGLANLEHARSVPFASPQHPGLKPKGPEFSRVPKFGKRFVVKILGADKEWHSNPAGPVLTICDRSLTVDGGLDSKCYPQLYNIVTESGVSSTVCEGWKKKFFWAQFHDEDGRNLSVFLTKFPQCKEW